MYGKMKRLKIMIRGFVYLTLHIGIALAQVTTESSTTEDLTSTQVTAVSSTTEDLTSTSSTTMSTTTTEMTTTVAPVSCGSKVQCFFADDHNKAMYLVLPCIILVYGGCGVIYCCSRIRRYFRREKRRKQREMRAMMGEQNPGYNDHDVPPPQNQPFTSAPPPNPAMPKPTAPYYNPGQGWKAEDCLAMEVSEIDSQLKQAFAMIDDVTKDIKNKRTFENRSKPDIGRQYGENDVEIKKTRKYKYKHFSSAA